MRPTQKGGSVVEESTLSTGLALHKEQEQEQDLLHMAFLDSAPPGGHAVKIQGYNNIDT